jgi:hypothetical protein
MTSALLTLTLTLCGCPPVEAPCAPAAMPYRIPGTQHYGMSYLTPRGYLPHKKPADGSKAWWYELDRTDGSYRLRTTHAGREL